MLLSAFPFASRDAFPTIKNYPFLAPCTDADVRSDSEFRFQLLVQTYLPLKAIEAIAVRESYRHVGMIPAWRLFLNRRDRCEIVEVLLRSLGAALAPH